MALLNIEEKEDSAAKLAAVAGLPTKNYLFAPEFNQVKNRVNDLINQVESVPNHVTGQPSTLAEALIDLFNEAANQEGDPVNLGYQPHAEKIIVTNSAGTDAMIPAATEARAGAMMPEDVTKLNGIEAQAQKNVQADWAAAPDAANRILNKPDLSVLVQNHVITLGAISRNAGTITIEDGSTWVFGGQVRSAAEVVLEIAPEEADKFRMDAIDITANGIELVSGVANYDSWLEPALEPGNIRITTVTVKGATIDNPAPVIVGENFVTKSSFSIIEVASAGIVAAHPIVGKNTLVFTGTATELRSLIYPSDQPNIFDGARILIMNLQATPFNIGHNVGTGNLKFEFHNSQPLTLQPGEGQEFVLRLSTGKCIPIRRNTTATGGVKVALFDFSPFAVPHTGTTADTLNSGIWTIPDSAIPENCIFRIRQKFTKTGATAASLTIRVYNNNNHLVAYSTYASGTLLVERYVEKVGTTLSYFSLSGAFPTDVRAAGVEYSQNYQPLVGFQLNTLLKLSTSSDVINHAWTIIEILS